VFALRHRHARFSAAITLVLAYVAQWPPGAAGIVGGMSYGR
jgi:hypothetical protein